MVKVIFNFEEQDKETVVIENAETDDSLLEIALKNGIDIHHNCGGVCACSTCHIYLQKGGELVEEISDKEEDFIDRAKNPKLESRLSCQCILLKNIGAIELTVPDQSIIQGE